MFERAFVDIDLMDNRLVNFLRDKGLAIDTINAYEKSSIPQLLVLKKKTPWIIKCPCSPSSVSCGYEVLDVVRNCTLGCKYCFLNTYTVDRDVILYANLEDLKDELMQVFSKRKWLRLGTGEFTDSMLLDGLFPLNGLLIEILASYSAILELKTKLYDIKSMLSIPDKYRKNVVLSWTINTEHVADKYECTPVENRIKAAREAVDNGYLVGFHFDPIVMYHNYINDYLDLIHNLASSLDVNKVWWISMGMLRLKGDMEPGMVKGYDGKLRYYRDDEFLHIRDYIKL